MINAGFPLDRNLLPMAISAAGAALALLTGEVTGLLIVAAAISIFGGRQVSLLSTAAFGLALVMLFLVVGWDAAAERELAVGLAVGLGISALVHFDQVSSSSDRDEKEARLIVESMPGHGWSADPNGRYVYVSPSTLKYVGEPAKSLDRIEGTDEFGWRQVVHPDDYDRVVARWLRSLKTGEPYENEHRIRRYDGEYRWFRNAGMPSRDAGGRITGWYGTTIDIHDQKTAELALRESEQRLQQLIDAVPALIWGTTPQGIPCYLNKRVTDVTGVTLKDMIAPDGARSLKVIHPDDRDVTDAALARSFKTGTPFVGRYRQRRSNGPHRWVESRAEPLRDESGAIVQWYGVSVDIEDLMTAQEALRERERELAQLVDMVPSHVWRLTPDGEPTFFNKRMVDFLGLDVADTVRPGMSPLAAVVEAIIHPDDAREFKDTLSRSLVTGETFEMRYRLRRIDGVYRWMSSRAEPLRDHDGRILQWYGLCHDIDEQMLAEQALRQSERQLQLLVDTIPAYIWCLTPEGAPSYFNKRVIDQIGLTVKDLTTPEGQLALVSVHPDDRQRVQQALDHSLKTGTPFIEKYRQRRGKAPHRWTEGRAEPLRDENGKIVQWYGVFSDIHEEVVAQQALREREFQLKQLVHMAPSYLWRLNPDGEPNFFNKRLIDFLGLDVASPGKADSGRLAAIIGTIVHPDDRDRLRDALEHCLASGERFSMKYRLRRADGVYRWMEGLAEPMREESGPIVQWYGLSHDIDDQLRAEEALRDSERQLQQMIDAVPVNILSFDPARKITYASKRYLDQVGSPLAHIEDFDVLARDLSHPADFPEMFRKASQGFATGQPFVNRFRQRDKEGVYRWIEARAQPLHDAHGAIVQWYIASIDIEDEMHAQEALRERERTLRQLVETLPAMLDCAAPNGEPIYRSQQLREFLGYELETLDGSGKSRLEGTLNAGVHPDDIAAVKEQYAYCLSTGEPYARRHRLRRFDGEYRWVETRAAAMRNPEGAIAQWNVICLDIDAEVRAQEELHLAQRSLARASQAASLAELSASIAHEVNQPLAAIVATSHACRRWLSADPPNLERAAITLERIIRDANSASEVVSRIRALFSQMGKARMPADITEVIAEVRRLMADELAIKRVHVETEFERNLPPALIDRVQIQQVFVNLIRNAVDALDTICGKPKLIRLSAVRDDGNTIRVEVRDLGPGIDEPERVFEPFFSTKKNGMGMGLAICRSIIESHDGRLWAAANEPRGTTFAFTLPMQVSAMA